MKKPKRKKSEAHTGTTHSEKTKASISTGQIGNRRGVKVRKYPEDADLPKYVTAKRSNGKITSYYIGSFPIGIDKPEYYPDKPFTVAKYGGQEKAKQACIDFLDQLKEEYKHIGQTITEIKEVKQIESASEKKSTIIDDRLPNHIYSVIEELKINGYYVDLIPYKSNPGSFYPRRYFQQMETNRANLEQAKKFVDMVKYIDENNVKMERFDILTIDVNDVEKAFYLNYYLPKYTNVYRKGGELMGFCVNGFPNEKYKGGKYKKAYSFKKNGTETLDMLYNQTINHLEELNNSV